MLALVFLATPAASQAGETVAPESAQAAAGTTAREAFARLRALAVTWTTESTKGWNEQTTFEVIARGSVVVQRSTFKDHPEDTMLTTYTLDRDRLVVTHYCEARNQPRLVATEITPDRIEFEFLDAGNLPSRDHGHMDRAVMHFLSEDRFSSRWTWYQDGEERWLEEITHSRLEPQ